MRKAISIGLCLALAGCVTPRQESSGDLKVRSEQAAAACRAQPLTTYVARAQCLNDAALISAPTVENPELYRHVLASRVEIAARIDRKEITPAEGARQYDKIQSQLVRQPPSDQGVEQQ
ncbi:hypothetical protein SAMN05444161_2203 [Rhizobiales bacterium GAS191]|nr:hypothetical protein SAMN05519103_01316 [Rhizobiales bacterium GAS113]SEC30001.1 hypothetical protein SAMN05519104_1117 [Rhizobiales bacterium GAS188]SEC96193.1 hypothetical protein SAMN05444161_2203 [Rhizobiales bacterium GAS191]